MSNSTLVTYKHICKHYDKGRQGKKIEKIFIHHMAGNLTVKQCGNVFDNRPASAHYGVNGSQVGLYVNESDTSWHCGNWDWNTRSIGIELANDGGANWHVSDATIKTAIKLIADICRRAGIKKAIYTGDMNGNICMHKWVCSTSCPGPYLSTKFEYITKEVNKLLDDLPSKYGKLEEDGIGGPDTVGSTQRFLGTTIDFTISGQKKDKRQYFPAFRDDVIEYDDSTSTMVQHLQWLIGVYEDGILKKSTVKALQKFLGIKQSGTWDEATMKAWQHYLNTHKTAKYPKAHAPKTKKTETNKTETTKTDTKTENKTATTAAAASASTKKTDKEAQLQKDIIAACKKVAKRAHKAEYGWRSSPSWDNIDKEGSCVSFVAVVLQILGYLKKGKYIWHNGKGYGTGKVTHATKRMDVQYMKNKTFRQLKKKLKKGDIIMCDDNKSGRPGEGGHIMIFNGTWHTKHNNPYVWDIGTKMYCERNGKPREYDGSHKILAIVRLKV